MTRDGFAFEPKPRRSRRRRIREAVGDIAASLLLFIFVSPIFGALPTVLTVMGFLATGVIHDGDTAEQPWIRHGIDLSHLEASLANLAIIAVIYIAWTFLVAWVFVPDDDDDDAPKGGGPGYWQLTGGPLA